MNQNFPVRMEPLTQDDILRTKDLIADVVLEFYGDLEFIPKTKKALLEYYAEIGYLDDLDDFINEYGNGNGAFYLLKESISVLGCGGIRCIGKTQGELVRLWLRT